MSTIRHEGALGVGRRKYSAAERAELAVMPLDRKTCCKLVRISSLPLMMVTVGIVMLGFMALIGSLLVFRIRL
jgi:hypothetical protein